MNSHNESKHELNELTEFNPALVYGFEFQNFINPEAERNKLPVNRSLLYYGQFEDMLNAYLYAQQHILPNIKEKGITQLTSNDIIDFVKLIHARIGKTIISQYRTKPGEFTKEQTWRWNDGTDFGKLIMGYFCGAYNAEKIVAAASVCGHHRKETIAFLAVLDKYKKKYSHIKPSVGLGCYIDKQIALDYHKEKLTSAEKNAIVPFALLPNPKTFSAQMQKYAEELLKLWSKCDSNNIDQVSELATYAFKELASIHPFADCNGRTATCIMNIVLRSLNKPSILLRQPGERDDTNSQYTQAIDAIQTNPTLLKEHIKKRLLTQTPYTNDLMKQIMMLKLDSLKLQRRVQAKYPSHNLNEDFAIIEENMFNEWTKAQDTLKTLQGKERFSFLQELLNKHGITISNELKEDYVFYPQGIYAYDSKVMLTQLLECKAENAPAINDKKLLSTLFTSVLFTAEKRAKIAACLKEITNKEDWKPCKHQGELNFYLILEDKEEAKRTCDLLNKVFEVALVAELNETEAGTHTRVLVSQIYYEGVLTSMQSNEFEKTTGLKLTSD